MHLSMQPSFNGCWRSLANASIGKSLTSSHEEVDAMIEAPDLATWIGRRDHVLLLVAGHSGFRVSELTGQVQDVHALT
jgi:site-specific recombinase XerD